MNVIEIKDKFEAIKANSTYLRVNEQHPLELYLGLNEQGQKTLRYNGTFTPVKIVGNSLLVIKQVKTSLGYSILFSFNSKENFTLFYKLCEDIINQTENCTAQNGYVEIVNRYNLWKKMFYGRKDILSEEEIQGLIGELLFLRDTIIRKYGTTAGLNSWSGPEPTHKDFSNKNDWFEIKSISNMGSEWIMVIVSYILSRIYYPVPYPLKRILFYLSGGILFYFLGAWQKDISWTGNILFNLSLIVIYTGVVVKVEKINISRHPF